MAAFDDLVPQFRRAAEKWPEAPLLAKHYETVAESFGGSQQDLVGSVKSFVECVCRTILGEYGKPEAASDSSTTHLLREALECLGLQNSKGASRLDDVLSAHNKMADALSSMRNGSDPCAHGKDGFLDALSMNECRAYLFMADSILALLLAACEGTEPDLRYTREPYERFERFHERIDHIVSIEASVDHDEEVDTLVVTLKTTALSDGIELRLEPSKLLYAVDRTAYVELLASALTAPQAVFEAEAAEEAGADQELSGAIDEISSPAQAPVSAQVVASYDGPLLPIKTELVSFLESLGGAECVAAAGTHLPDSLLAVAERGMGLDWSGRETLQAALRVALRRTLTKFGIETQRAENTAQKLVDWFRAQDLPALETSPAL